MKFICEKCGKRAGGSAKHASYALASNVKRAARKEFGKGEVRVVLTGCMDLCPDDSIAIALHTLVGARTPTFLEADVHDPEAASEALLERVRRLG